MIDVRVIRLFLSITVSVMFVMIAGQAAEAPASSAAKSANLILNHNFAHGSGESPDHWRSEGWISSPEVTEYRWDRPVISGPGELIVKNLKPNDSRWLQSLALSPGWYYISAEARAIDVGAGKAGVTAGILEDGIMSPGLHGTTGWKRIGFYLKIGRHGADVNVALRLGGNSSLNTGTAIFRNAGVTAIVAPPAGAAPAFDLEAIRRAERAPPVGKPWTLAATFAFLAILAAFGWRIYGDASPRIAAGARAATPSSKKQSKKRKRNHNGRA